MKNRMPNRRRLASATGFTLVELLVVIAIIGILAGLIIGLAGVVNKKKQLARVNVELKALETAIESYKEKLGSYPPDNTNNCARNQLFYELTGTTLTGPQNGMVFQTVIGGESIPQNQVATFFTVGGFANSGTSIENVHNFLKSGLLKHAQVNLNPPVQVLTVPVDGPNPLTDVSGKPVNPWRYVSTTPTNNPGSYDLWAEIKVGGKTTVIGNWR